MQGCEKKTLSQPKTLWYKKLTCHSMLKWVAPGCLSCKGCKKKKAKHWLQALVG